MCVVAAGFTIAAVLIKDSFDNWADNQITTTIETLPISAITFPKVCSVGVTGANEPPHSALLKASLVVFSHLRVSEMKAAL